MKGLESFNRRHSLPAILLFVLITVVPIAMASYRLFPSLAASFSDRGHLVSLGYSILTALACSLACSLASVIIALPGAYIFSKFRFPLKGLVRALCLLSLAYPVEIGIQSLEIIEPFAGLPMQMPAINSALALVMMNTPLVVLIISSYWSTVDDGIRESARTLGIGRSRIFRTITLPYLGCALRGSIAIVFIRCLMYLIGTEPLLFFIISLIALAVFCSSFFGRKNSIPAVVRQKAVRIRRFSTHLLVFLYCVVLTGINLAGPTATTFAAVFTEGRITAEPIILLFSGGQAPGTVALIHIALIVVPSALIASMIASRLVFAVKYLGFPLFPAMIALASGNALVFSGYMEIMKLLPVLPIELPAILFEIVLMIPISVVVILPRSRSVDSGFRSVSATLGFKAGASFRKTESRLLLSSETAAVLICTAIGAVEYSAHILEVQGLGALTLVLTAISFILLLAGSSLLRKVA